MFDKIGRNVIDRFLNGYTNLIFTYGITGSGKTHTISGRNMDGLMPKILEGIFNHTQLTSTSPPLIYASYLENYTNEVYDLLAETAPGHSKENIPQNNKGHKDKGNKVTVRVLSSSEVDLGNLTTIQIGSKREGLRLIEEGSKKRSKAHTKLNTVTLLLCSTPSLSL